jgi:hypothetical protein
MMMKKEGMTYAERKRRLYTSLSIKNRRHQTFCGKLLQDK